MSPRLRYGALLALAVVVLLATSTGAYSSTADRSATVDVVSDPDAYLGITTEQTAATSGEEFTLFELTNRFGTDLDTLDVTVAENGDDLTLEVTGAPSQLADGSSGSVEANVTCDADASEPVTVRIEASGEDVHVTKWKDVTVDCTAVQVSATRTDDGSLFTGGQTDEVEITVDANREVLIRDRIPQEYDVTGGGDYHVETENGEKYVVLETPVEDGTRSYLVEVPNGLTETDTYRLGPIWYSVDGGQTWVELPGTTDDYNVVVGVST